MTAPAYRIEITHDPQHPEASWDWRVYEVSNGAPVATGLWASSVEQAKQRACEAIVRLQNVPDDVTLYATEAGEIIDAPVAT